MPETILTEIIMLTFYKFNIKIQVPKFEPIERIKIIPHQHPFIIEKHLIAQSNSHQHHKVNNSLDPKFKRKPIPTNLSNTHQDKSKYRIKY